MNLNTLNKLLDNECFDEARSLVTELLQKISSEDLWHRIKLNCILIDIGTESHNEVDLETGISFFENNKKEILSCITEDSYYYNIANAKHSLGKIFYSRNKGVHSIDIVKEKFQEPINLYWIAYKKAENINDELSIRILINLSNALVTVGRVVEALQFLDTVLEKKANFPQALVSRADNLHYLTFITSCSVSKVLYYRIYRDYDNAIKTNQLPISISNYCRNQRQMIQNIIEKYNSKINDFEDEAKDTLDEYLKHTDFRRFCISNFLTLNEHAIYCKCVASENDDLRIGVPHAAFKGKIVARLELLLNRLKSEFSLARWLFYQSTSNENLNFDTKYSELLDGEIITPQSELLRTSFRICYGLMDKIALGVCKLYGLDCKRIYFESFWNDPKRHEEIIKLKNVHLNALFSIANDLNTTTGELKHFKNWRNKLEHNLLILKNEINEYPDILKLFEDSEFIAVADFEDFKNKTLHLLQLTRAAIFSFVYCVRIQTIDHKENQTESSTFNIDFK